MRYKEPNNFLRNLLLVMLTSSAAFSMKRSHEEGALEEAPLAKKAKKENVQALIEQANIIINACVQEYDFESAGKKCDAVAQQLQSLYKYKKAQDFFTLAGKYYCRYDLKIEAEASHQRAKDCEQSQENKKLMAVPIEEKLSLKDIVGALNIYRVHIAPEIKGYEFKDSIWHFFTWCLKKNKINNAFSIVAHLQNVIASEAHNKIWALELAAKGYGLLGAYEDQVKCLMMLKRPEEARALIKDLKESKKGDDYLVFRCYFWIKDYQNAIDAFCEINDDISRLTRAIKAIFEKQDLKGALQCYKMLGASEEIIRLIKNNELDFSDIKDLIKYFKRAKMLQAAEDLINFYAEKNPEEAVLFCVENRSFDAVEKILNKNFAGNYIDRLDTMASVQFFNENYKVAAFLFNRSFNEAMFKASLKAIKNDAEAIAQYLVFGEDELALARFQSASQRHRAQGQNNEGELAIERLLDAALTSVHSMSLGSAQSVGKLREGEYNSYAKFCDKLARIEQEAGRHENAQGIGEMAIEYYLEGKNIADAIMLNKYINNDQSLSSDKFAEDFHVRKINRLKERAEDLFLKYSIDASLGDGSEQESDLLKAYVFFVAANDNEGIANVLQALGASEQETEERVKPYLEYFNKYRLNEFYLRFYRQ